MRMRILEALAWQIPVVTTTTGCEGIAVENERHLLIADQPGEMATAILRVAREAPLARSLRSEGRRLVEEGYSLEAAGKLMQQVYRRCCEDRAPGTERGRPAAAPSPGQPAS
jgi:glycosyltransferase involved in cell wall biosynthesis